MKKAILLIPFFILLFSCSGKTTKDNNDKKISDLVEFFKKNNFKIENQSPMMSQLIGASEGVKVSVDGHIVELYKYDTDDNGQKEILEKIEEKGVIKNGFIGDIPAKVNGSFVIISYQSHPEKDKIIDVFSKFE